MVALVYLPMFLILYGEGSINMTTAQQKLSKIARF